MSRYWDSLPPERWTVIREWKGKPRVTWAVGTPPHGSGMAKTIARGECSTVREAWTAINRIMREGR